MMKSENAKIAILVGVTALLATGAGYAAYKYAKKTPESEKKALEERIEKEKKAHEEKVAKAKKEHEEKVAKEQKAYDERIKALETKASKIVVPAPAATPASEVAKTA